VAEQLKMLKKEVAMLVRKDARVVGIDLEGDAEGVKAQELKDLLERIKKCETLGEVADVLQGFLEKPEFKKILTPELEKYWKESISILKDVAEKLRVKETAAALSRQAEGNMEEIAALLKNLDAKTPELARRVTEKMRKQGILVEDAPETSDYVAAVTGVSERGSDQWFAQNDAKQQNDAQEEEGVWAGWEKAQEKLPQKSGNLV
jgi:hypothetical protein